MQSDALSQLYFPSKGIRMFEESMVPVLGFAVIGSVSA